MKRGVVIIDLGILKIDKGEEVSKFQYGAKSFYSFLVLVFD